MVSIGLLRKQQYAWQATSMALRIVKISERPTGIATKPLEAPALIRRCSAALASNNKRHTRDLPCLPIHLAAQLSCRSHQSA